MPGIAHLVSLRNAAGVEAQFAEFIRRAADLHPRWRHVWLNPAGSIHPMIAASLNGSLDATLDVKRIGPIRLPSSPRFFRAMHCRRVCRKTETTIGVVWNKMARSQFFLDALGEENVIHWEHGRAWHPGRETDRKSYLDRITFVIANSNAAKRVLQIRWDYTGAITVCLNALRPSLVPPAAQTRHFPGGRPIRLGAAARLLPVKGVPLVLHALKAAREETLDAELHIAGEGVERNHLEELTAKLGLRPWVRFHGPVSDMAQFYAQIDCLVHLPLTEAFGLVCLEAAAYGCPVIAAAVDGLPESVSDGVSGRCLPPSLPLADYSILGSGNVDVPPEVYDPASDRMLPARLVDPGTAARAIVELFAEPDTYEQTSRAGSERALHDFRFDEHVADVLRTIEAFSRH